VSRALLHAREQIEIARRLVTLDPAHVFWRQTLATGQVAQASALLASPGSAAEALPQLRPAVAALQALLDRSPEQGQLRQGYARARVRLAQALLVGGDVAEALEEAEAIAALSSTWVSENPGDLGLRDKLAEAWIILGMANEARGEVESARIAWKRAVEACDREPLDESGRLDPHLAAPRTEALLHLGLEGEALSEAERLAKLGYREPGFIRLCRGYVACGAVLDGSR
jgi:tetratricopeptide (TPR) repeat protein